MQLFPKSRGRYSNSFNLLAAFGPLCSPRQWEFCSWLRSVLQHKQPKNETEEASSPCIASVTFELFSRRQGSYMEGDTEKLRGNSLSTNAQIIPTSLNSAENSVMWMYKFIVAQLLFHPRAPVKLIYYWVSF